MRPWGCRFCAAWTSNLGICILFLVLVPPEPGPVPSQESPCWVGNGEALFAWYPLGEHLIPCLGGPGAQSSAHALCVTATALCCCRGAEQGQPPCQWSGTASSVEYDRQGVKEGAGLLPRGNGIRGQQHPGVPSVQHEFGFATAFP